MPIGNRLGSRNQFIQLLIQRIFHQGSLPTWGWACPSLPKVTSSTLSPIQPESLDTEVSGVWCQDQNTGPLLGTATLPHCLFHPSPGSSLDSQKQISVRDLNSLKLLKVHRRPHVKHCLPKSRRVA